jgi:hypothetical protein
MTPSRRNTHINTNKFIWCTSIVYYNIVTACCRLCW